MEDFFDAQNPYDLNISMRRLENLKHNIALYILNFITLLSSWNSGTKIRRIECLKALRCKEFQYI